jgi:hypothetical protein
MHVHVSYLCTRIHACMCPTHPHPLPDPTRAVVDLWGPSLRVREELHKACCELAPPGLEGLGGGVARHTSTHPFHMNRCSLSTWEQPNRGHGGWFLASITRTKMCPLNLACLLHAAQLFTSHRPCCPLGLSTGAFRYRVAIHTAASMHAHAWCHGFLRLWMHMHIHARWQQLC